MQDTLQQRIQDNKPLTEGEQAALLDLFGKRCKPRRLYALKSALACVPDIDSWSIYGRVFLNEYGPDTASYCAGQDYPREIRNVRELLTY